MAHTIPHSSGDFYRLGPSSGISVSVTDTQNNLPKGAPSAANFNHHKVTEAPSGQCTVTFNIKGKELSCDLARGAVTRLNAPEYPDLHNRQVFIPESGGKAIIAESAQNTLFRNGDILLERSNRPGQSKLINSRNDTYIDNIQPGSVYEIGNKTVFVPEHKNSPPVVAGQAETLFQVNKNTCLTIASGRCHLTLCDTLQTATVTPGQVTHIPGHPDIPQLFIPASYPDRPVIARNHHQLVPLDDNTVFEKSVNGKGPCHFHRGGKQRLIERSQLGKAPIELTDTSRDGSPQTTLTVFFPKTGKPVMAAAEEHLIKLGKEDEAVIYHPRSNGFNYVVSKQKTPFLITPAGYFELEYEKETRLNIGRGRTLIARADYDEGLSYRIDRDQQ
ncbi:MAG: hypothetical protein ACPG5T_08520 [Endozoicomonas sp.]